VLDAGVPEVEPALPVPSKDASSVDPIVRDTGTAVAPMQDGAADGAVVERDAAIDWEGEGQPPRTEDAGSTSAPDAGTSVADPGAPPATQDAGAPSTACLPGTYTGAFTGAIRRLLTTIQRDVTGTVSLTLAAGTTAGTLTIAQGSFMGMEADGDVVKAKVTGVVSCTNRALVGARLAEGTFADPLAGGDFGGPLTGTFDDGAGTLQGAWVFDGAAPVLAGQGTWTAKR